jgi:hypothetical protein
MAYEQSNEGATPEKPGGPETTGSDDRLSIILDQFRDAFDASWPERDRAARCRDYYDGFQWTEDELTTLMARKQPPTTANRIAPKINALLGYEKTRRTDPKAYPRTPKHEKDAEGATDALRYITEKNCFDEIRSDAAENTFIEGAAAATVVVEKDSKGAWEVCINLVPYDRFYRDPHSRKRDFSDARFMGSVLWMDEDEAIQKFASTPDIEDVVAGAYSYNFDGVGDETYDDRPRLLWCDTNRRRIRVLQHRWIQDGQWHCATVCAGGFLRAAQVSPYLDDDGLPDNDMVAVSAFVTRENQRYGVVWNMLSIQDEINKRRSKALHLLSMRQVVADHGAVKDVAKAKKELAKPDGWVEVNPGMRLDINPEQAKFQGELVLLQEAKAEIDASGVNPSLEGDRRAPSGRAQELQTATGLQEQSVVFDAMKHWSWRIYRSCWCRVRQFWNEEKWIRVTDDESNLRWVGLNHPVTAAEEVQNLMQEGRPIPPQLMQIAQMAPETVVRTENPVAELDVDILVEDGPDTVTVQAEQFAQLVELKKADPTSIPTEMVIEASNLRNKDRILEHLKQGAVPPQVQQQMQQMGQQLQDLTQQLSALKADRSVDQFNAETKRKELEVDAFDAETKRIQATKPDVSGQVIVSPQGLMQ